MLGVSVYKTGKSPSDILGQCFRRMQYLASNVAGVDRDWMLLSHVCVCSKEERMVDSWFVNVPGALKSRGWESPPIRSCVCLQYP